MVQRMAVDDFQQISQNQIMSSPTFKSVAALAGWDEESLLIASFNAEVLTDRSDPRWKSPSTNSKGKRKVSTLATLVNLDEESEKKKKELKSNRKTEKEMKGDEWKAISASMDRLREEFSCAINLFGDLLLTQYHSLWTRVQSVVVFFE